MPRLTGFAGVTDRNRIGTMVANPNSRGGVYYLSLAGTSFSLLLGPGLAADPTTGAPVAGGGTLRR